MVEYAYAYPTVYYQTGNAFINLGNITNDSLNSYASAMNIDMSSPSNAKVFASSFSGDNIPEGALVTNTHYEIACQLISHSQFEGTAHIQDSSGQKASISTSLTILKIPLYYFQQGLQFIKSKYADEIRIYYIRRVREYEIPRYSLTAHRLDHNNLKDNVTGLNVNITNLNKTGHTPKVHITIPDGVAFSSADKSVQVQEGTVVWEPQVSRTKLSDSLDISFQLNTLGVKTFNISETTNTSSERTVSFTCVENIPDDTPSEDDKGTPIAVIMSDATGLDVITNTLYQIGYNTLSITVRCDDGVLESLDYITFTDSQSLCGTIPIHDDSDFVDNTTVFELTPTGSGGTDLQIKYQLTVDGVSTVYYAQHYILNVLPNTLTYPYFTVLKLNDEEKARLGDHTNYTVQTYMKINNNDVLINDWLKNYRIGVYNPEQVPEDFDITDLTLEEIFDGVEEWSDQPSNLNEYDSISCTFTYHNENPLYIVITGDYAEGNPGGIVDYSIPSVIETSTFTGYESTGNYPMPIEGLISDTVTSSFSVNKFEESTTIVLSDFDLEDGFGTNDKLGVTGVAFNIECDYNDILSVLVRLKSPDGLIGQRSIILDEQTSNILIGGPYDTFGFDVSELTNLEDFEIELQVTNLFNNTNNTASLTVHNASITFYYNEIDSAIVDVLVDGSDIRYYGLFLDDVEMPEGLKTITKYLEIEGTDSHDSYRQNIDRKEIKVKMGVDSCNINDTTEMLRKVSKLFQNKRDSLNKPIPKRIEFSNFPDLYWEYILEDPFDTTFNYTSADITLKLVIPSGTAFAKEETVTSVTGGVTGLAKVNPKIVIIPLGDHVEVLETSTQQKFSLNYTNWGTENLVEIDCINREVLLKENEDDINPTDISAAVDFNSDWFILDDDYNFEPTNCIIRSVTFTERW